MNVMSVNFFAVGRGKGVYSMIVITYLSIKPGVQYL